MKLAIISDIHEDVVNLKLALQKIEKLQCGKIVCLGDISGFSVPHYRYFDTRDAHECLRIVRENCEIVVPGNHDLQAAKIIPQNIKGFEYPDDWYDLDYRQRKEIANGRVWLYDHDELDPLYTREDTRYIAGLPETEMLKVKDRKILFSHYVYPNLSGSLAQFYHEQDEFQEHFRFMSEFKADVSFTGHAHPGGLFLVSNNKVRVKGFREKYILNGPTIISVPAIAGNRIRNGFCIFDTDEGWVKAVRV
jgi:predicted phosphodiesterase